MGAPKGNTNALKHGLYAQHFNPAEQEELRKMSPEDYRHELYMMRVAVRNLFDIQKRLYEKAQGLFSVKEPMDVDGLTKISNSLSLAVTALNATARTYALFTGTDTSINDTFEKALNSLAIFQNDTYLIEADQAVEKQAEILTLPEKVEE